MKSGAMSFPPAGNKKTLADNKGFFTKIYQNLFRFFRARTRLAGSRFSRGAGFARSCFLGRRARFFAVGTIGKLFNGHRPEVFVLTHRAAGILPVVISSFFNRIFVVFNHNKLQ